MAGRAMERESFQVAAGLVALPIARLYSVSVEGGPTEALPMPQAGSGDYSPDSSQMVYSPQSRDFRPEKRYGGGQANSLYISI